MIYLNIFNLVDSGQESIDAVAEDVPDGVAAVLVDDVTFASVEGNVLQFCHLKHKKFFRLRKFGAIGRHTFYDSGGPRYLSSFYLRFHI